VTEEGYSRVPIYKGSLDNIIGVVYTKDLITLLENRDLIILQDILRPPYFVPDAIKISKLMRDLQQKKIHMAIVVDEFGGTQGIITMEDILEEIVGEIHDEYDEVLKDVEQSADGSALVNGRIAIEVFNEKFEGGIPEDPEYETLNGFLAKHTGRLPEVQEEIRYGNLQFTVLKKSNRRIRLVKVRKVSPPPEEPEEN
jgi:CBS domain containing-hemolysin-like protein